MITMTKLERVIRTINFQETDRIPVYDLIDNDPIREYCGGGVINENNAWEYEYKAVRRLLDMTRSPMVPNFSPGRVTDEDGFVYFHGKYTSWLERRPFDDLDGLIEYVKKDTDRKGKWYPDAAYIEAYRKCVTDTKAGIGDDTTHIRTQV